MGDTDVMLLLGERVNLSGLESKSFKRFGGGGKHTKRLALGVVEAEACRGREWGEC